MSIIDSEKWATGPVCSLLELGLYNVKYNGYSILVVIPNNALVSVCSVRSHNAISLTGELCRLIGLHKGYYGGVKFVHNASATKVCLLLIGIVASKEDVGGKTARIVVRTLLSHELGISVTWMGRAGIIPSGISHRAKLFIHHSISLLCTLCTVHRAVPAPRLHHALWRLCSVILLGLLTSKCAEQRWILRCSSIWIVPQNVVARGLICEFRAQTLDLLVCCGFCNTVDVWFL